MLMTIKMKLISFFLLILGMVLIVGCGDSPEPAEPTAPAVLVTVHVYTNNDGGSVVWCPDELDPVPTEWTYNGTAEVDENSEDVLSQCELE